MMPCCLGGSRPAVGASAADRFRRENGFPPYSTRSLSNGLQVIAVSHHEQPVVSLRLLIRAGGASIPTTSPALPRSPRR